MAFSLYEGVKDGQMDEIPALTPEEVKKFRHKYWWCHLFFILMIAFFLWAVGVFLKDLFASIAAVRASEALVDIPTARLMIPPFLSLFFPIFYVFFCLVFLAPHRSRSERFGKIVTKVLGSYFISSVIVGFLSYFLLIAWVERSGYQDCQVRPYTGATTSGYSFMWGHGEAACEAYRAQLAQEKARKRAPPRQRWE